VSRVVTLTGNCETPGNWEVALGTPVKDLLALARPKADTDRTLMGGPMMGFAMPRLDVPVVKGTNCIISASPRLFPPTPPEQPCIRCTECSKACPVELQPFELYWFSRSKNFGKAQEYNLFDCIECGACAYVCPAHIPLVDYFRFSKSEIWARERDKTAADQARERFEFRNYRQEREKAEKAARLAAKAAETKARMAQEGSAPESADDAKKALIAAAMERAKQQKAVTKPKNTEALDPATQAEIAEIDARRAQAGTTADASVPDLSAAQLNDPSEDAAAASSTTPADDHVQPH
jgi:electron transport complex protein RnfC